MLKKKIIYSKNIEKVQKLIADLGINTVCHSARCPNLHDCFGEKTATFLILGDICTRNCNFCSVKAGSPGPIDAGEPANIANAVKKLGLEYAVITSVTRDDLADGGAGHFARTVQKITKAGAKVELLIPDFNGDTSPLETVVGSSAVVIGHNLETVPRLYKTVRPQADYDRSIEVLRRLKELNPGMITKTGLMVGLGEKREEVIQAMQDALSIKCDIFTIGHYLRPSKQQLEVVEEISEDVFKEYERLGREMGFKAIASGPFVRSSYRAGEIYSSVIAV